jgi:hypothetical protein
MTNVSNVWFVEKADSRSFVVSRDGSQDSATLKYAAGVTESELLIRNLADSKISNRFRELYLQHVNFEPLTGGIWEITAEYGIVNREQSVIQLDTSGGSEHVTQSLATIARYGNAPDCQGAVNFDGESVQGADIMARRFAWSEQYRLSGAAFTPAYRITLFNLTYSVNNASFRGLAAGQVLFMGATAARQGLHPIDITYYFEASPNIYSYYVGDIAVTQKRGWEYQWVRYLKEESSNRIIEKPDGVYIEQMYPWGNFAQLGIGTGSAW